MACTLHCTCSSYILSHAREHEPAARMPLRALFPVSDPDERSVPTTDVSQQSVWSPLLAVTDLKILQCKLCRSLDSRLSTITNCATSLTECAASCARRVSSRSEHQAPRVGRRVHQRLLRSSELYLVRGPVHPERPQFLYLCPAVIELKRPLLSRPAESSSRTLTAEVKLQ